MKVFSLRTLVWTAILLVLGILHSCKHESAEANTDQLLFEMAQKTAGFVWYKNSGAFLEKSSGSGHPQAYLRTRYNAIAAANLDPEGNIIEGSFFAEGALIVKELYENPSTLSRYAILYKKPDHQYADARGWVWGYVNANGKVASEASKKGASCINCHSQSGHIDYMLMNKFFP